MPVFFFGNCLFDRIMPVFFVKIAHISPVFFKILACMENSAHWTFFQLFRKTGGNLNSLFIALQAGLPNTGCFLLLVPP